MNLKAIIFWGFSVVNNKDLFTDKALIFYPRLLFNPTFIEVLPWVQFAVNFAKNIPVDVASIKSVRYGFNY